ncbi:hypothetical protein HYW21_05520 [Candidatus Woesearchaeota archaeon]|nr:hypothetical protein [Candidatus Woesearchaeota archaeon]
MADCGLANLGACLPEKFFEYILSLINAPLQWLLDLIRSLLTEPVDIYLFGYFWAIVIYILSLFYGLLLTYSGFRFMFSGHDVIMRENAKSWLKNIIIMMVLVQASFFLYELVIEVGAALTAGIMTLIPNDFFLLTADSFINFTLELVFGLIYLIVLLITLLVLVMRYLFVGIGVIFFPIGLFLLFIPPLQGYGKGILHLCGTFIFMTFFQTIILLAASLVVEVPFFEHIKILVMICAFLLVNILVVFLMMISIGKINELSGMNTSLKVVASRLVRLS